MSVEIDEDEFVAEIDRQLTHGEMQEAARRWFSASQDHLEEAIQQRAGIDAARDQRGSLTSREQTGMFAIHQSGNFAGWDDATESFVFTYSHFAAVYHEFGTEPHEITADDGVLAFEWPDAPDEVVAMFSPGGDEEVNRGAWDGWVYFKSVDHPGTPAIGFVRRGRAVAVEWLEGLQ